MNEKKEQLTTAKMFKYIVIYSLLFALGSFCSSLLFDLTFRVVKLPDEMNYLLRALGNIVLTFIFFYLYTIKKLHLSMQDFRITAAIRGWGVIIAVILPALVALTFIIVGSVTESRIDFTRKILIIIASLLMAFKAGLLEEMLFRGYIMKLLEMRWNKRVAILLPSILFSLAHIPSMGYFSVSGILLLVLSGTLVGIMFSLIVYKGNSISNSVILHTIWNFVMITDILHITTADGVYGHPIFSVIIPSNRVLLTGAGFGVEASAVAIIGYLLVICWLMISAKKSH